MVHLVLKGGKALAETSLLAHLPFDWVPSVRHVHHPFLSRVVLHPFVHWQVLSGGFVVGGLVGGSFVDGGVSLIEHFVEIEGRVEGRNGVTDRFSGALGLYSLVDPLQLDLPWRRIDFACIYFILTLIYVEIIEVVLVLEVNLLCKLLLAI